MKYVIIFLIVIIILYLIFRTENFDISANLNLSNDAYSSKLLNEKRVPLTMFPPDVEDNEIPMQVKFDKTIAITDLQKLKSINNILERVKEVNPKKSFNDALQPVTIFTPEINNLSFINNYINSQIQYYSGNQYNLIFKTTSDVKGYEIDTEYNIYYIQTCIVDNLKINIIIDVVLNKPDINNPKPIVSFNELRIDNPSIYITPNKYEDNHALISDY